MVSIDLTKDYAIPTIRLFPENTVLYSTVIYKKVLTHSYEVSCDGKRKQDRRWNADKPSATLDAYIPIRVILSPANHRPAQLLKMSLFFTQVELMRINFRFEAPIIQVQIITYIIY